MNSLNLTLVQESSSIILSELPLLWTQVFFTKSRNTKRLKQLLKNRLLKGDMGMSIKCVITCMVTYDCYGKETQTVLWLPKHMTKFQIVATMQATGTGIGVWGRFV